MERLGLDRLTCTLIWDVSDCWWLESVARVECFVPFSHSVTPRVVAVSDSSFASSFEDDFPMFTQVPANNIKPCTCIRTFRGRILPHRTYAKSKGGAGLLQTPYQAAATQIESLQFIDFPQTTTMRWHWWKVAVLVFLTLWLKSDGKRKINNH